MQRCLQPAGAVLSCRTWDLLPSAVLFSRPLAEVKLRNKLVVRSKSSIEKHLDTNGPDNNDNTSSSRAAAAAAASGDGLPPLAKVHKHNLDMSIDGLNGWVEKQDLNLRPEYQRGMVWDLRTASRLVVTVLENRIVPPVYLEEDENGTYLVMDGKQRLTSLLAFMKGSSNVAGEEWKSAPIQLDVNEEDCDPAWKGVSFRSLPKQRQKNFEKYSVPCIIIEKDTDRDVVFSIYRDINSGGVKHSAQQIRKVAFHGPYARLLDDLAANQDFLKIQGRDQPDGDKEQDRELVLRFFAMWRSRSNFTTPMWKFLNNEMKAYREANAQQLQEQKELFCRTTALVWNLFGPDACRLPPDASPVTASRASSPSGGNASATTSSSKKVAVLDVHLWDALMVAVAEELRTDGKREREMKRARDTIQAGYRQLCSSKNFTDSLNSRSKKWAVQRVWMMQQMLQEASRQSRLDPRRAFPAGVKQQLIAQAQASGQALVCAECHQIIQDWELGEAEVDHMQPWSLGGPTHLGNAQLLHRSCNRSKGNRQQQHQHQQHQHQQQQQHLPAKLDSTAAMDVIHSSSSMTVQLSQASTDAFNSD